MAITRSTAANRARSAPHSGRALELWLLLPVSIVLIAGIWLVLKAQFYEIEKAPGITGNKPLNLNEVRSPGELQPMLGFYDTPQDRNFAAQKIIVFLQDHSPIESVGALRTLHINRRDVEHAGGAKSFVERLGKTGEKGDADADVPLLTAAQMRLLRPSICVRTESAYTHIVLVYSAIFFLGFYVLHIIWRIRHFNGDRVLLPLVHFLSGLGYLMMIRLRDPLRESLLFQDFAIGVGIGCVLAFLASLPDYERSPLRRLAYVPLLGSFILSLALILFGSGPGLSDARINLQIGPIQFQPVELIKLLLIFFLASFFSDRWEFLRQLKQAPRTLPPFIRGLDIPMLRYAAPMVIAAGLAIAFFFLERDLGPALVMMLLFILLYIVARARVIGSIVACGSLVAAIWIGYVLKVPQTVAARLSMWLSPWDNYVKTGGDHLAQSWWTFATGGFFGTGLGLGDPATVPAAHTDLILATIGEELGFVALVCIGLAYAVLIYRALRISIGGRGAYSLFLGMAAALLIGLQAAFISAGILGLVPLSGVVTPFINYGRTSTISNFVLLGILASLSKYPAEPERNEAFRKQASGIGIGFAVVGMVILGQAARVQIFGVNNFMGRGALVMQADGHRRYVYNPRILDAMHRLARGSIFDRNGVPMATDSARLLKSHQAQFDSMQVNLDSVVKPGMRRLYPFGAVTFHMLGDVRSRLNWGAPNSTYIERDWNTELQGYDDRAMVVRVRDHPEGPEHITVRRDLRELMPLVQYRYSPDKKEVRQILSRKRDISLSIDVGLQIRLASILRKHILASGNKSGAAIVIDPASGDLLASVTYPWEGVGKTDDRELEAEEIPENSDLGRSLLDRPRYGLYPPGSSFKLIASIAALASKSDAQTARFECKRLPDGRIGNYVRGWGKPIRDDILDKAPHGSVDMAKGLTVSCNAYFAQLGTYMVGAQELLNTAGIFGIKVASPNTVEQLQDALPQASYGQGQVVVSPLQMARVAGAISNQGRVVPSRIVMEDSKPEAKSCLAADRAAMLSQYLRSVVTDGTGREANKAKVAIAGKTGTAELKDHPAHAWFVGFAPYGLGAKKIAFAVLIENGRYGGKVAAPAAADLVNAAIELGLIRGE
jgi:cell division protein FtsW (lipid II flippase)